METLILYTENKQQLVALKAFAKALKIKFEVIKSPYNPDFVARIKESEKQIKDGKYIVLDANISVWEN